jgi:diguanylate cyclase (GGDEF)-like protein/PAS domain S-box-containing protein
VEARSRSLEHDADGQPRLIVGTLLDISARKASEAERQLADLVFTGISDGICITDAQRNILRINKAFSHITGYEPADVLGQNPRLLRSGNHDHAFFRDMWEKLDRYDNWQGEIVNRRKDGSLSNEWLSISCVRNAAGAISHYVGLFSDLSERQAAAERIQYLSSYDTLTGLPNRALFADRLDQALLTARRFERGTALILFDLDRFRVLNDTLGPPVGDQILVEVGRRLQLQVREGDTVGRLSGNEFGFVMANLGHERDALALAQRILDAIAVPFAVAGQSLSVTASIGISVFPKNGQDGDAMLTCADAALLRTMHLKPGMVLTRELAHRDGYLLLAKGSVLTADIINQLVRLEQTEQHNLTVYIRSEEK